MIFKKIAFVFASTWLLTGGAEAITDVPATGQPTEQMAMLR